MSYYGSERVGLEAGVVARQDWSQAARYVLSLLESSRVTSREAAIHAANLLFAGTAAATITNHYSGISSLQGQNT
eukprot:1454435-Amphidinium_carterae.1